jgi:hypothetical protein
MARSRRQLARFFELGRGGSVTLVAPDARVEVSVLAPGFRATTASVRDGDHIALQRGLPVRVRLPEAEALPPGIEYALVLTHAEEWVESGPARGTTVFDVTLPQSGDYELAWSLRSVITDVAVDVWEEETVIVHVTDSAMVQEFDASLDPSQVTSALEQLLGTGGR